MYEKNALPLNRYLSGVKKSFFPLLVLVSGLLACSDSPEILPPSPQDFCSSIHRNDSLSLSAELAPLEEMMKEQTGVYVLEDGGGSMIARAWLSEYAERTIDIQYFIFSTDNVGLIACDYLVRAADRGVKVRILVDDIMVDAGVREILVMDSHENIDIKIYNPGVNLGKNICQKIGKFASDFAGANQRMHNKTFVIDGKVVITGGRNIADEYFDYDHEYNFRDRDVLLLGKAAGAVSASFEEFWKDGLSVPVANMVQDKEADLKDTARFDRLHQYACNPENFWPQVREKIAGLTGAFRQIRESGELVWADSVVFISDAPGKVVTDGAKQSSICTDSLIALVNRAQHTLDIQSPYLITTAVGKVLLASAVKRGVKVRVLTNSLASTDNLEAFSGYQRDREQLLATGIRVFEFRPDAKVRREVMTGDLQKAIDYAPVFGHHAKSMVIDGRITVIGTFNLDPRSAYLNTECVTVIYSEKVAAGVLKGMEVEFAPENSWETTATSNPDAEAGAQKRMKVLTRRVVPKEIL